MQNCYVISILKWIYSVNAYAHCPIYGIGYVYFPVEYYVPSYIYELKIFNVLDSSCI